MNHTENTYRHPSEGQPLAVRFLIASFAIGFLLLVCSAPRADARPGGTTFSRPCRVVAAEADAHDGKLDRIAARHGGIDYSAGRWTVNDTGKTFGYSREEDARVYATARCARIAPAYLNSPDFTFTCQREERGEIIGYPAGMPLRPGFDRVPCPA